MDDLDRLYRRLAQIVRESYPQLAGRPFQLADVTHHLVPYRHHRRELGLDSVQAYERALMRLAAGERGYLSAPQEVQSAFRASLASSAPDAELLRTHGEAMVTLVPDPLDLVEGFDATSPDATSLESASPEPASPEPASPEPASPAAPAATPATAAPETFGAPSRATPIGSWGSAPTGREATAGTAQAPAAAAPPVPPAPFDAAGARVASRPGDDLAPPAELPPRFDDASAFGDLQHRSLARMTEAPRTDTFPVPSAASAAVPAARRATPTVVMGGPCRYCGQALPEGRAVTFCPSCGQNVTVRHCPACSTELEIGWRFCITCGREVDDVPGAAPGGGGGTTAPPAGS